MKFQKINVVSFVVFFLLFSVEMKCQNDGLHCFVATEPYVDFALSSEQMPEVNVLGNGMNIDNNAMTFSGSNNTDFGTVRIGEKIQKTFVIQNLGKVDLNIGDPAVGISGTYPGFSVLQPEVLFVLPGNATVFSVAFSSNTVGDYTEMVKIYNDDEDESVYTFMIKVTVEK